MWSETESHDFFFLISFFFFYFVPHFEMEKNEDMKSSYNTISANAIYAIAPILNTALIRGIGANFSLTISFELFDMEQWTRFAYKPYGFHCFMSNESLSVGIFGFYVNCDVQRLAGPRVSVTGKFSFPQTKTENMEKGEQIQKIWIRMCA